MKTRLTIALFILSLGLMMLASYSPVPSDYTTASEQIGNSLVSK